MTLFSRKNESEGINKRDCRDKSGSSGLDTKYLELEASKRALLNLIITAKVRGLGELRAIHYSILLPVDGGKKETREGDGIGYRCLEHLAFDI